MVIWVVWWWRVGHLVGDLVTSFSRPGTQLAGQASAVSRALLDTAEQARDIPFVGDQVARPLESAGRSMSELAVAGAAQAASVAELAGWVTVAVIAVPVGFALVGWLPVRVRFVRRALALAAAARDDSSVDLLALRALANRPWSKVRRVHPDPVAAWRAGDPKVMATLAALELAEYGVRPRAQR